MLLNEQDKTRVIIIFNQCDTFCIYLRFVFAFYSTIESWCSFYIKNIFMKCFSTCFRHLTYGFIYFLTSSAINVAYFVVVVFSVSKRWNTPVSLIILILLLLHSLQIIIHNHFFNKRNSNQNVQWMSVYLVYLMR